MGNHSPANLIHQDEGHYSIPGDNSTRKPNCHAHIVWDWMNHETGKSCKLGKVDMSLMQDMVAECLEMECGTRKEKTGKEHLERTDFIIAKQKQEMEEAANKKKHLEHENQIREKIGAELDEEIARKQNKVNRENGNTILSNAAKLLGKGKYADMEKKHCLERTFGRYDIQDESDGTGTSLTVGTNIRKAGKP